jgi:hypothetical protein
MKVRLPSKAEYRLLAILCIASVVLAGLHKEGVQTHLFIVIAFVFWFSFRHWAGNME